MLQTIHENTPKSAEDKHASAEWADDEVESHEAFFQGLLPLEGGGAPLANEDDDEWFDAEDDEWFDAEVRSLERSLAGAFPVKRQVVGEVPDWVSGLVSRLATRIVIRVLSQISATDPSRNTSLFAEFRSISEQPDTSLRAKLSAILGRLDQYLRAPALSHGELDTFRAQFLPILTLLNASDDRNARAVLSALGNITLLPEGLRDKVSTLQSVVNLFDTLGSIPEGTTWEDYLRLVLENDSLRYLPDTLQGFLNVMRDLRRDIRDIHQTYEQYQNTGSFAGLVDALNRLPDNGALRATLPGAPLDALKQAGELGQNLLQLMSCESLEEYEALLKTPSVSQFLPGWVGDFVSIASRLLALGQSLVAPQGDSWLEKLLWIYETARTGTGLKSGDRTLDAFKPYAGVLRTLLKWQREGVDFVEFMSFLQGPDLHEIVPPALTENLRNVRQASDQMAQAGQLYGLYQSGELSGQALFTSLERAAEGNLVDKLLGTDQAKSVRRGCRLLGMVLPLASSPSMKEFILRLHTSGLTDQLPGPVGALSSFCSALMKENAFNIPAGQDWLEWAITAGEQMLQDGSQMDLEAALPLLRLLKSLQEWSVQGSVHELAVLLAGPLLQSVMTQETQQNLKLVVGTVQALSAAFGAGDVNALMQLFDNPAAFRLLASYLPGGDAVAAVADLFSRFPSEGSEIEQLDWLHRAKDTLGQSPSLAPLVATIDTTLGGSGGSQELLNNVLRLAKGDKWAMASMAWSMAPTAGSVLGTLSYYVPTLGAILGPVSAAIREEGITVEQLAEMDWTTMQPVCLNAMHRIATENGLVEPLELVLGLGAAGRSLWSGKGWEEVLKTASKNVQSAQAKTLFTGGILAPVLVWKLSAAMYKIRDMSKADEVQKELRQVVTALTEYLPPVMVEGLQNVIPLIPWLPVLQAVYREKKTLPEATSWVGWLKDMLGLLADSKDPAIVSFRAYLEEQVTEALSDVLVNGTDSTTWESGRALVSGAAGGIGSTVTALAQAVRGALGLVGSGLYTAGAGIGNFVLAHTQLLPGAVAQEDDRTSFTAEHVRQAIELEDMDRAAEIYRSLTPGEQEKFNRDAHKDKKVQALTTWIQEKPTGGGQDVSEVVEGAPASAAEKERAKLKDYYDAIINDENDDSFRQYLTLSNMLLGTGAALTLPLIHLIWKKYWEKAPNLPLQHSVGNDVIIELVPRQKHDGESTEDCHLMMDSVASVSTAPSAEGKQAWLRQNKLLMALAVGAPSLIAAGAGSYYIEKRNQEAEGEYLEVLESIDELEVANLDFLFYGELANSTLSRQKRDVPDTKNTTGNNVYVPSLLSGIIKGMGFSDDRITMSILDTVRKNTNVMSLHGKARDKAFFLKVIQYFSVITAKYSYNIVKRYRPLIDRLWEMAHNAVFENGENWSFRDLFLDQNPTVTNTPTTTETEAQERIEASVDHVLSMLDTLRTPILNMRQFIDDKITEAIRQFNDHPMRNNPQGKWVHEDPWESFSRSPTPGVTSDTQIRVRIYSDGQYYNHNMTLRDVIMGKHIRLRNEKGVRAQIFIDDHRQMIDWIRAKYGLEEKMIQATTDLKSSEGKMNSLTSHTKGLMLLRCVEYLSRNEPQQTPAYKQAVEDFLAGTVQAQEVFYNDIKLNDVFMIPVRGTKKGVLFSANESVFFHVGEENKPYTYEYQCFYNGDNGAKKLVSTFPVDNTFKEWVLNRIPLYNRDNSIFQPNSTLKIVGEDLVESGCLDIVHETHPFSFTPGGNQDDMARKLVDSLLSRLESDADALIRTDREDSTERWLEIGKWLTMYASFMMLPVSMAVTGPLATALTTGAMATLDALYVIQALEQEKNADTAGEAESHRYDAILAGVLAGLGHGISGAVMVKPAAGRLVGLYRQAKFSLKSGVVAGLGQYGWKKLASPEKTKLMTDLLSKAPVASTLSRKGITAATIADLIRPEVLKRVESTYSDVQKHIQELLERELADLEKADSVVRGYLDEPLLLPRDTRPSSTSELAEWVAKDNVNVDAVKNIINKHGDSKYNDILNINTIETIYREITSTGVRPAGELGALGSSIKRSAFTKMLDEISIYDALPLGDTLYAAVMHYKPFATNNKAAARILYTLAELRDGASVKKLNEMYAESILSGLKKVVNPTSHDVSQLEEEGVLNNISKQIHRHPESEHTFKIGDTVLLGRRERKVFSISVDGKHWQESNSKILLAAWSLQNAGRKNKAWSLPMGLTGNQRSRPIPGNVGENTYGRDIPVGRPDLNDAGEWEGARGTLPGTDEEFFQAVTQQRGPVDADEINYELLEQMRVQDAQVPKKTFMRDGIALQGRVQNGIFEISADGGLNWRRGTVWDEFSYRLQTKPLLSFGLKYFNELNDANPRLRLSRVARKVAEDNHAAFTATGRSPKDPLAPYGAGESWDSVFKLEKKSGLITQREYAQVKESILTDSHIFVGEPNIKIRKMHQFERIRAGSRIALTDSEGELVQAMISGGDGVAYGSNNYLLGGPSYWSEINLSETFEEGPIGLFYVKRGKTSLPRRGYRIYNDYPSNNTLPAARNIRGRLTQGTIGTVADLGNGTVEKVFSVPSMDENGPRMVSAKNNAEGFNRYYGEGSGSAMVIPVTKSDGTVLYQARNILCKVPGVSLDTVSDIDVFRAMKIDIARKNPVETLTAKLRVGGINHNDINAGNIMYDKTTGEFNLIDFDSATYTDKSVDGSIPSLSEGQTTTMRNKLQYVLGENSMGELVSRQQSIGKWSELPSSISSTTRAEAESDLVREFAESEGLEYCGTIHVRKKRALCTPVNLATKLKKPDTVKAFIEKDKDFQTTRANLRVALGDKYSEEKVRELLVDYGTLAGMKDNKTFDKMTYEKLEAILKADLMLTPEQRKYMTSGGWRESFLSEVADTIPGNYWSVPGPAAAKNNKKPKITFNASDESHVQIAIYRSMNITEAEDILDGKDIVKLHGHLGDLKQAATYYGSSEKGTQALLKFTLKPGAHTQLFSPDNIAFQQAGKGAGWIHGVVSARNPGKVIQEGSGSEGTLADYIGIKSENTGEGFSYGMGKSGSNLVGKTKFKNLLERVDVVLGPEDMKNKTWIVNEVSGAEAGVEEGVAAVALKEDDEHLSDIACGGAPARKKRAPGKSSGACRFNPVESSPGTDVPTLIKRYKTMRTGMSARNPNFANEAKAEFDRLTALREEETQLTLVNSLSNFADSEYPALKKPTLAGQIDYLIELRSRELLRAFTGRWKDRMEKLHASVNTYSQGEHIGNQDGLCNPSSVLMAYAIQNDKADQFIGKLNAMDRDSTLLKQLRSMHKGTEGVDAISYKEKIITINTGSTPLNISDLNKETLFGGKAKSYVIDYAGKHRISFTGIPTPVRGPRKYDIYLFDANVGLARFGSFEDFKKALMKQQKMYSKLFDINKDALVQTITPLSFEGMTDLRFESQKFQQIIGYTESL